MNRLIKFRVWQKEHKFFGQLRYNLDEYCECSIENGTYKFVSNEEIVYQQFTGLTDKNGKEIYEGDILKCHSFEDWGDKTGSYFNKVVEFSIKPAGESVLAGFLYIPEDREIIGNIFENPELL